MLDATAVIVNPDAHHGRLGHAWSGAERDVLRRLAPAEAIGATTAAEAEQAAHDLAMRGFRRLVCAGDTATLHGVLNAFMALAESHRRVMKLGLLTLVRRDAWGRAVDHPRGLQRQLELLRAAHTLPYDVGRVECRDAAGAPRVRHFVSGAALGLAGALREGWRQAGPGLIPRVWHMHEALRGVGRGSVRLVSEEGLLHDGSFALGMIMSGSHYPWLGRVAPQADPSDGWLDLVWLSAGSLGGLAARTGRLMLPPKLGRTAGGWHSVQTLDLAVQGRPVEVELDGVPAGRLPARVQVMPRALPLIVASVAARIKDAEKVRARAGRERRLVANVRSTVHLHREAS